MLARPSAAADSHDDLEAVAVVYGLLTEAAAGHDFPVAIDRDLPARQIEPLQKLRKADGRLELTRFSVDGDGDH